MALKPIGAKGFGLRNDRDDADYANPFPGELGKQTEFALESADYIVKETGRIRGLIASGGT